MTMTIYVLAFLIGLVAGLRSLTAPAAVAWAARLGWLPLRDTGLALLGSAAAAWIFSLCAIVELIADKLPRVPSRKAPPGFIARIAMGALCGAALGASRDAFFPGLAIGIVGAVTGTLGGYQFRKRLVQATGGKDLPIALLEDAIAVAAALFVVSRPVGS